MRECKSEIGLRSNDWILTLTCWRSRLTQYRIIRVPKVNVTTFFFLMIFSFSSFFSFPSIRCSWGTSGNYKLNYVDLRKIKPLCHIACSRMSGKIFRWFFNTATDLQTYHFMNTIFFFGIHVIKGNTHSKCICLKISMRTHWHPLNGVL